MAQIVKQPLAMEDIPWVDSSLVKPIEVHPFMIEVKQATGKSPVWLKYVSEVPWLAEGILALNGIKFDHLPPTLVSLIDLIVAQDNSCRYCYGATRTMMKIHGYSESVIRKIETEMHTAPLPEREKVVLEFCRKVSNGNPRPKASDLRTIVKAGFSYEAALDAMASAAIGVFFNRMATLIAIPPEPGKLFKQSKIGRMLQPVISLVSSPKKARPWVLSPLPAGSSTPLDPLFMALEGFKGRDHLRWMMSKALESDICTRSQKAMMASVIAAGLECQTCARGSKDILIGEGWTEKEVENMVMHLSSPKLSSFEERLVRFARETVRYRVETMHDHCKKFFSDLSRPQVVEIIGFCSLVNALGRMTFMMEQ